MKNFEVLSYLISIGIILVVNYFLTSKIETTPTLKLLVNLLFFTFVLTAVTIVWELLDKRKKPGKFP